MKHAREDYNDKVVCIHSKAELLSDLEDLQSRVAKPGIAEIVEKIISNIHGGHIPLTEPVFLLRGQDIHAPEAVRNWARLNASRKNAGGCSAEMVSMAMDHADAMQAWPVNKVADIPGK
jgi:hypothetical protein